MPSNSTPFIVVGLLALVAALFGWLLWANTRRHEQRWQRATANGWRYSRHGWAAWFRSSYVMAGTTASGVVWELRRERQNGRYYFVWRTTDARLRYGMIQVMARERAAAERPSAGTPLRPYVRLGAAWPAGYVALATHDRLGDRYLTAVVGQALAEWPGWPAPGSLEAITADSAGFDVTARYHDSWPTIERLVTVGTALVANVG